MHTEGSKGQELPPNPLAPEISLEPKNIDPTSEETHLQLEPRPEDSATTKAEVFERTVRPHPDATSEESSAKRIKLDTRNDERNANGGVSRSERQKGVAPIKAEYLVHVANDRQERSAAIVDDDAEEASHHLTNSKQSIGRDGDKRKSRGQNTNRQFGASKEDKTLCPSRVTFPEFSPRECQYGDDCKFEHDLRKYLADRKREDLVTFGGICPIWDLRGCCDAGWKCRFLGSHQAERDTDDGRKELILVGKTDINGHGAAHTNSHDTCDIVNVVSTQEKINLARKKTKTPKADAYLAWMDRERKDENNDKASAQDNRALYTEPPFLPSEKCRIYFGPETPVLAPLTTQGNLPFRRLCVSLGAQVTYSEMAMGLPLLQGQKSEWALMRAHSSELTPPSYDPKEPVVTEYNNSKDLKFGAQIAANKPWLALKTTEVLTNLLPHLRLVDLNCGCPIDLVYRAGAGSALLDSHSKLEKMLRGMNAVSGPVPITAKIRMGTKNDRPTAEKLIDRLVFGGGAGGVPSGVAAISLHGRSRQQRYTKTADWSYIADCAALINRHKARGDSLADTIREPDPRDAAAAPAGKVFFIGNGDCYSHTDYTSHLNSANVDAVMLARGALIKPWIFEEIEKGQYLDKSASERLGLVERFVKFGLEYWGSDEVGVGTTRRFLLEWLSFAYRYVPVGLLEYLPPSLQDRPPAWRGRDEVETLLGSGNYLDWIRISEMFLGPAHKDFKFMPKHKSNSYEIEAEG